MSKISLCENNSCRKSAYFAHLKANDGLSLAQFVLAEVSFVLIGHFNSNGGSGESLLLRHSAQFENRHLNLRQILSLI